MPSAQWTFLHIKASAKCITVNVNRVAEKLTKYDQKKKKKSVQLPLTLKLQVKLTHEHHNRNNHYACTNTSEFQNFAGLFITPNEK